MKRWSILTIMLGILGSWALAQQPDYGRISTITAGINKGDTQAMLDAGNSGSSIYVDPLRKFLEKAEYAELALAKLGDKKAFAKIIAEAESEDPQTAIHAIGYKLPYLGGPEPTRVLAKIILNPKFDKAPRASGGGVYLPLGDYALKAFVQLVPDVPVSHAFAEGNPAFMESQREKVRAWIRAHPQYLN